MLRFTNFLSGGRGIRTPGTLTGTTVFKTAAIDHSATPPREASRHFHAQLQQKKSILKKNTSPPLDKCIFFQIFRVTNAARRHH